MPEHDVTPEHEEAMLKELIKQAAPLLDEQTPPEEVDPMTEEVEPLTEEEIQRIVGRVREKIARGKES